MWELEHKEGWEPKNWCFWIVVLEKILESPWRARRSNQSVIQEINPESSLEGLMLKLKLQYFGHLMGRANSLEQILMLEKIEGRRRSGWQRLRWLDGPLLLLPSIFPSIRVFSNELALPIRWLKYCSFSFSLSPSNEYSGLISLRIDWFDFLAV